MYTQGITTYIFITSLNIQQDPNFEILIKTSHIQDESHVLLLLNLSAIPVDSLLDSLF